MTRSLGVTTGAPQTTLRSSWHRGGGALRCLSLCLLVTYASLAEAKGTFNLSLKITTPMTPLLGPHGMMTLTGAIGNYSQTRDTINSFTIYVDGVSHAATVNTTSGTGTWNWNRDNELNPSEHFVYATAQVSSQPMPGSPPVITNLDSRDPAPDGDGLRKDFILAEFRVDRLQYDGDFALYDRAQNQDVVKPQFVRHLDTGGNWVVDRNYPAGFVKGNAPTVVFGITTTTLNNVTGQYDLHVDLAGEPATGYPVDLLNQPLAADMGNAQALPALPNYVYNHLINLTVTLRLKMTETNTWINYPSLTGGAELTIQSGPGPTAGTWMCTLADPNNTFPRYKLGGTGAFQTKPWYVMISNALDHVTKNGADKTVISSTIAMPNLTTDLYVWPNRPDGAGTAWYDSDHAVYYLYNDTDHVVVFDLWRMAGTPNGDCRDFAAYLESEARSLGISDVAKRRLGSPGGGFLTNLVIPCGIANPPNHDRRPAVSYGFGYHQMTSRLGGIYDFAIAFNYSAGGHPWKLATGSTTTQEYSDLVASPTDPLNPPQWSSPFALGDTDPFYHTPTGAATWVN